MTTLCFTTILQFKNNVNKIKKFLIVSIAKKEATESHPFVR